MRLLRVITSLDPRSGGPAQGIRNSIPILQNLGCKNEVVCLDDPDLAKTWGDEFIVHALGTHRGRWAFHANLLPWLQTHRHRFDAVIIHGLWLYHSHAVRNALSQPHPETGVRTPYYVFPHGMLDPWFQKAPGRRLKALRNWVYWKAIEQKVIRDAAGLLFTCEEELRLARTTFHPYQPQREINVGYGIKEPPVFDAGMEEAFVGKCPAIQGRSYLLFLSRIHPKKGVDLLLRAYARTAFSEHRPDLVIAGPGLDSAYGQEMQDLSVSLGLAGSVHFPGMLTGDAKWGAFYGCEAFILPSHQENFGIAVVEAMACGKPVLISNQVNIWREIETSKGGLVDSDDLEGTLRLLNRWQDISKVTQATLRPQECFNQNFAIQRTVTRLIETLQLGFS